MQDYLQQILDYYEALEESWAEAYRKPGETWKPQRKWRKIEEKPKGAKFLYALPDGRKVYRTPEGELIIE